MSTDKNATSPDKSRPADAPANPESESVHPALPDEELEEVAGGFNGAPLKPVWRPKPAQPPIIRTFE